MLEPSHNNELPAIPGKRYFTIGEVADLCYVKPHVLRYWEQEFTQLRPMKRRGNRRYYQHHEVLLIRRIRGLLYEQGFTISGARNQLHDVMPSGLAAQQPMDAHTHAQLAESMSTDAHQDALSLKWSALRDAASHMPAEALCHLRDTLIDIRTILDVSAPSAKEKPSRS